MARTVIPETAWASAKALVDGTVVNVDKPGILPPLTDGLVTLTMHVGPVKRKRNQRRLVTNELALNGDVDEKESTFRGGIIEFCNGTGLYSGKFGYGGRVAITVPPGQYTRRLRPPST